MKQKIVFVGVLFIVILGIFFLINSKFSSENQNMVCFENHCFEVELAITPEQRSRGLMFRENLDEHRGMLFVFGTIGNYPFWMKNTLIPLDIIWIDDSGTIVFINEDTQPCREISCPTIDPQKSAKYVLEINGGLSQKIGLKIGGKMKFNVDID